MIIPFLDTKQKRYKKKINKKCFLKFVNQVMDVVLPDHIQKLILNYIDNPIRLLKLKNAHKTWSDIINHRILKSHKWRELCLKDIPSDLICTIITRTFPKLFITNFREISDISIWYETYRSYRRWLLKWKYKSIIETINIISHVSFVEKKITCSVSCDEYLAIGVNISLIYLFDIKNLTTPLLIIDNGKYVAQIQFWYSSSDELILVSKSLKKKLTFFNALSGKIIPSDQEYKAKYMCVGTMNNFFSEFHNLLVEYHRTPEGITIKRQLYLNILVNNEFSVLFSQEDQLLKLLLDSLSIYLYGIKIPIDDDEFFELQHRRKSIIPSIIYPKNQFIYYLLNLRQKQITKYYLKKNQLYYLAKDMAILVSEKNQSLLIYGKVQKWKEFNPFGKFPGVITSVVLHGKTLIVGLHTGEVYVYVLEDMEELKTSELDPDSAIKFELKRNKAILSLNISETKDKLYIFASTESKTYVIKLFSTV